MSIMYIFKKIYHTLAIISRSHDLYIFYFFFHCCLYCRAVSLRQFVYLKRKFFNFRAWNLLFIPKMGNNNQELVCWYVFLTLQTKLKNTNVVIVFPILKNIRISLEPVTFRPKSTKFWIPWNDTLQPLSYWYTLSWHKKR